MTIKRFPSFIIVLFGVAAFALIVRGHFGFPHALNNDPKNAHAALHCATKKNFTLMWSIYAGWMPWPYAQESGILDQWACKEGIAIQLKQADYISSIEAYVAGQADGVLMTNMEALTMAGSAGIDSTAVIIGDYSNGNDAIITRNNLDVCDLKGEPINLVEYSVSHYLLDRALELRCQGRLTEHDLKLVNVSDSDLGPTFITNAGQHAVVAWNPIVLEIRSHVPKSKTVFDSSSIPYEILDIFYLRTDVVKAHPELARALVGAWYETLALMRKGDAQSERALTVMASRAGSSLEEYKQQIATTHFWWDADDAAQFTRSEQLKKSVARVDMFSAAHGLYGEGVTAPGVIGMTFPDGSTIGAKDHVKVRYSDVFMQEAAKHNRKL